MRRPDRGRGLGHSDFGRLRLRRRDGRSAVTDFAHGGAQFGERDPRCDIDLRCRVADKTRDCPALEMEVNSLQGIGKALTSRKIVRQRLLNSIEITRQRFARRLAFDG